MSVIKFPVYDENEDIYISAFGLETVGEKARWGPSRRTEGILHYVLSGKGIFNGTPVCANQGFYIAPSEIAEYYPDPEEPWIYFWINASPEFARRYMRPAVNADSNGIFDFAFNGALRSVIDKILAIDHQMGNIESLAFGFTILNMHTPKSEVNRSKQYVLQAKNYIESHLNQHISVYDVAKAVSVHDRYLYSLFMQYEGIAPKEYIIKRKIETAQDLLVNTPLSICEIASAAGFADIYSFSRSFKLQTDVSPTKFRKMHDSNVFSVDIL